MDSVMAFTYASGAANLLILLALLYPGIINFSKTRSRISAALLLFNAIFLLENIVAIFFHLTIVYTPAVEVEVAVLTVLQTLSFGTLLWATYK